MCLFLYNNEYIVMYFCKLKYFQKLHHHYYEMMFNNLPEYATKILSTSILRRLTNANFIEFKGIICPNLQKTNC